MRLWNVKKVYNSVIEEVTKELIARKSEGKDIRYSRTPMVVYYQKYKNDLIMVLMLAMFMTLLSTLDVVSILSFVYTIFIMITAPCVAITLLKLTLSKERGTK